MRRRAFIAGLGSAAVWPLVARAQGQRPVPVVGFLSGNSSATVPVLGFFREGMKSEGFIEGQSVALEFRAAEGQYEKLPAMAADLVNRKVSVIVADGAVSAPLAAKQATTTIPIVFFTGSDPVQWGLVHGSSVCAAKVRFALGEKNLAWQGHYLDILKGDQFAPEYQKLNPKAVVPTLIHDDNVIVESTVINEYLDESFPDVPLKPKSPVERADMRVWTKAVDENLHPACGEITFASCHRHIVRRLPEDKFQAFLNSTPPISVTAHWHERKKEIVMQGLDAPGLGATFRLYDGYLSKMEKAFATRPWLAGETFSLADIAVTPYVNRLDMLAMTPMWEGKRPRVTEWFNRIKARAAFKPAFLDWCPPDLTADLLNFGRQSWPSVERLLAQAG